MPRQVSHPERRREIIDAVARIAVERGVSGVGFRDVAAEAGMSVSLVQHYFGTKERLMVATLDATSQAMATHIGQRLESLPGDTGPLDRVRAVVTAFLPDDDSRSAMLLYLSFGGAALTDAALRSTDAFRNAGGLIDFLADQLEDAHYRGNTRAQALALLSLVLGLSLAVLLEQTSLEDARAALDAHLALVATR